MPLFTLLPLPSALEFCRYAVHMGWMFFAVAMFYHKRRYGWCVSTTFFLCYMRLSCKQHRVMAFLFLFLVPLH